MIRKILAFLAVTFVGTLALGVMPAQATEKDDTYMTIVWEMPSWDGPEDPTWPQTIVSHVEQDEPSLDVAVPDCGYFQVDTYKYTKEGDIAKVDALISGGVLNGPGNPPEPLIPGGWGKAYKLVNQGKCPGEQPEPKVEVVTIDKGEPVCDSETVPTETTTTTTEYVWDKESEEWVAGQPKVEVTEGTRPLTEEEQAALEEECVDPSPSPTPTPTPTVTPTPTPTPTQLEELPHTGPVDPMLPLGGLALIGAGAAALLGARRHGAHS